MTAEEVKEIIELLYKFPTIERRNEAIREMKKILQEDTTNEPEAGDAGNNRP